MQVWTIFVSDESSKRPPKVKATVHPSPWLREKPIGEGLRQAYRAVEQEPVPEKLKKLMEELKRREAAGEH